MQPITNQSQFLKIKWAFTALAVIVAWFALVLQFTVSIPAYLAAGRSLCSTLVQLFSYYTILSNLLMVLCLTFILTAPKSAVGRFFLKQTVLTSIALYITIVAVIYNVALRNILHLEGSFKLANELLHVVTPLLFIIYWFAFVPKQGLKYRHIWAWLLFPFIYFIYALFRGEITGDYPYPFLNVLESGYQQVFINALILLPVMWGLGALYVLIARRISKAR